MNSTYSNKALPAGTVLREWRLEEVLGVGGFGIVYKGRGIYFGELVAIKEYFPSAISERQEGDTVVPIDSNAEEVHALGLKKFVEEAKLLWNLSTPTRHPNIVSVRSLFEIHGTAYIVMDFEDGKSLSKLLREGKRFNEVSLLALIQPIAEGLERAHRVGVLHRDIKPPNILVSEEGRPVLIDFGSARFESGDATSTKVTFHTPPYAAIEQYVKTYAQGPWTDIYALGVVLYECITSEMPPEVLERMHGGLGKPLVEGEWPGFSRTFLSAVDAAMTIRPTERPQSISEWLALFSRTEEDTPEPQSEEDPTDVTRFVPFMDAAEKIVPVAPPPPDFEEVRAIETPVPDSTSQVEFKIAGQITNAGNTQATEAEFLAKAAQSAAAPMPLAAAVASKPAAKPSANVKKKSPALAIGLGVAAIAILGAGGWYLAGPMLSPDASDEVGQSETSAGAVSQPLDTALAEPGSAVVGPALQTLADEARSAGAPVAAVTGLSAAAGRLTTLEADRATLSGSARTARDAEISAQSRAASAAFANAIGQDADARAWRLSRDLPWANPRLDAARREPPQRQRIAQGLRQARGAMTSAIARTNASATPGEAIGAARQALQASRSFIGLFPSAYASKAAAPTELEKSAPQQAAIAPVVRPSATPTVVAAASSPSSTAGVSSGKMQRFNSVVATSRDLAAQVIAMSRKSKPSSGASKEETDAYRTLQQNKSSAQGYQRYLDTLASSLRGAKNDQEADRFISQAEQTKRYLDVLMSRSTAASQR